MIAAPSVDVMSSTDTLIDNGLKAASGRNLMARGEVLDLLLDIRSAGDDELAIRVDTIIRNIGTADLVNTTQVTDALLDLRSR